jgi:hypothetical protein
MNKEVLWPSISKGGPGSGRYPAGSGEGETASPHASKDKVSNVLDNIKHTEMKTHGRIAETRTLLDSILKNPNATNKQKEKAKRYSNLLKPYEAELK